jgi:hypothetical protein
VLRRRRLNMNKGRIFVLLLRGLLRVVATGSAGTEAIEALEVAV